MHAPKDRSYGKFGVLIDTYGTAYPAYQYKILEGSPTPGAGGGLYDLRPSLRFHSQVPPLLAPGG